MTGIIEDIAGLIPGVSLVVPTIEAGIQLANLLKSSYDLFSNGKITEDELKAAWQQSGVTFQAADANLQAAEDDARAKG